MDDLKLYCEKIYQEYRELKKRLDYAVEPRDYHRDKDMEPRYFPPQDMERLIELEKELKKKCEPHLNLGLE